MLLSHTKMHIEQQLMFQSTTKVKVKVVVVAEEEGCLYSRVV